MHRWIPGSLLALSLFAALPAFAQQPSAAAIPRTAAPEGAKVYFISPTNGAEVSSPIVVRFGLSGAGVAPAGVNTPKTGHHHLLVDGALPANMGLPFPNDATHLHFGGGQTETTLTLPPGKHTLQLVLGDDKHIPHEPPIVSEKITITVK